MSTNKYGGMDDLQGEKAFIEQLAQCLSVLSMHFSQISEEQAADTHIKIVPNSEFDLLQRNVERACKLLETRRAEIMEERKAA